MPHLRQWIPDYFVGPLWCSVTLILYAISAAAGLHFVLRPEGITPIWPATGIALAIMTLCPRRHWPWVLVGIVLGEILATMGVHRPINVTCWFVAADVCEALIATVILTRFGADEVDFSNGGQLLRLIVAAGPANAIAAVLAAAPAVYLGFASSFWHFWRLWFVADGLGILLVTPVVLSFASPTARRLSPHRFVEACGILLAAGFSGVWIFSGSSPDRALVFDFPFILTIPLIIWAALRMNLAVTTLVSMIFAAIGVLETVAGRGPFVQHEPSLEGVLVSLQIVMMAWAACGLAISGAVLQHRRSLWLLSEREVRFRLLATSSPAAIVQTDAEGQCVYVSERWQKISGQSFEQASGEGWTRAIHPEDVARVRSLWRKACESVSDYLAEYRVLKPGGEIRWVSARMTPLRSQEGVPQGHVGLAIDVTDRIRVEEEMDDRRRFHALIADLSANLVDVDADKVDQAVKDALVNLGHSLDLDRVTLSECTPDNQRLHIIFSSVRAGAQLQTNMRMDTGHPWAWPRLKAGEIVSFNSLDELPPEADTDKASWLGRSTKSLILIPISVGGSGLFVFAAAAVARERQWSDELAMRFRVLGETFANAIIRARMDRELRDRLRFEVLISDVSKALVNVSADDLKSAIDLAMRSLRELIDVDRVNMTERSPDGLPIRIICSHAREGIPINTSIQNDLQYPWISKRLAAGENTRITQLDDLPPEADVDRQTMLTHGLRSLVVVPLSVSGKFRFAFSVGTLGREFQWPEELPRRLQVLGEAMASAIVRARADQDLRESEAMLRRLNTELLRAEEKERRRLATALHDELAQNLFAAVAQLVALRAGPMAGDAGPQLDKVISSLDESLRQARELTFELCPPVLYELGLVAALSKLGDQIQQRNGLTCNVDVAGGFQALDPDLASLLYQAVRELLMNVVKHARASRIDIRLEQCADQLRITVGDDGIGMVSTPGPPDGSQSGFGLFNIKERLRTLGGKVEVISTPGDGCSVRLVLPASQPV